MVSFIHSGSEITTWAEYSSKPKAQNPKQHFKDKNIFFLISSFRSSDQHKDTGVVSQVTKTAIFIAVPMKKTFSSSVQARFLFFSLHKIRCIL